MKTFVIAEMNIDGCIYGAPSSDYKINMMASICD